jgi:AcrR family transcriptional regulator
MKAAGRPARSTVQLVDARCVGGILRRVALDRRQDILRHAYLLIAQHGLEGLRFADVARAAGINNGTLIYYFPNKEALIQGVVGYMLDEFRASQPPRPADGGPLDAETELRWEFDDARKRLGGPLGVVYLELLARAQRDPRVAESLRALDAAWDGWLQTVIEAGQVRGGFLPTLDPTMATTAIRSVIRGAGIQALLDDPQRIDAVMGMMAELFLHWLVTGAPTMAPPRSLSPSRRGSGSSSRSGSRTRRPRAARASD